MATETKETSEAKHSPTLPPWVWQKFGDEWCLVGAYGMRPIILNVGNVSDGSRSKRVLRMRDDYHDRMIAADANHPDAKLIVRAVNSHAALVEACEEAEKFIGARLLLTNDDARKVLNQLTAAIAAAKEAH